MKILVIGNGFDLDLGLETSFNNFFHSKEFMKVKQFCNLQNSLAEFLIKEQEKKGNWFDIEEAMAAYAKQKETAKDFSYASGDKLFLDELKRALHNYVTKKVLDVGDTPCFAKELIRLQNKSKLFDKIYSFNCFDCNYYDFASFGRIENLRDVVYLHNYLDKIILGVGMNDCTDDNYSFLKKVNQEGYSFLKIMEFKDSLLKAGEIYIFGHSLNRIDMVYFSDLFCQIPKYGRKSKHIIFITKDQQSEICIKENISRYAIPYRELEIFCKVSFVYTAECKSYGNALRSLGNM